MRTEPPPRSLDKVSELQSCSELEGWPGPCAVLPITHALIAIASWETYEVLLPGGKGHHTIVETRCGEELGSGVTVLDYHGSRGRRLDVNLVVYSLAREPFMFISHYGRYPITSTSQSAPPLLKVANV